MVRVCLNNCIMSEVCTSILSFHLVFKLRPTSVWYVARIDRALAVPYLMSLCPPRVFVNEISLGINTFYKTTLSWSVVFALQTECSCNCSHSEVVWHRFCDQ
jgi:hypothetical protein